MPRLPGEMDGRRFLRAMSRPGWAAESQRGSHRKLRHTATGRIVIVAFHDTIRRNALHHVLRLAEIAEDDFLREL